MTLAETINTLRTGAMQITQPGHAVSIFGADAFSWLQGQVTQDLSPLKQNGHVAACLCNPTGQLLTIIHFYSTNGNIFAITPDRQVILDRIENFVIIEEVSATVSPMPLVSIQGVDANGRYPIDRTGFGGYDTFDNPYLPEIPAEHLNALEIAAGIPRPGVDTNPKTLPPELGPAFEDQYVSYTKGCYVGQEVLQRIHSRGHTNKTWVGLISNSPLCEGICNLDGKDVGIVHRTAEHPELGYIASATLRNEASSPGTQVSVNSVAATVRQMPLLSR